MLASVAWGSLSSRARLCAAPLCLARALIAARHALALCSLRGVPPGGANRKRCREDPEGRGTSEPRARACVRVRLTLATTTGDDASGSARKLRRLATSASDGRGVAGDAASGGGPSDESCGGGGGGDDDWCLLDELPSGAEYVTVLRQRRWRASSERAHDGGGEEPAATRTVVVRGGLVAVSSASGVAARVG
jgi:hypothetical protein